MCHPRDAVGHDVGKPTPSVAMLPADAIFSVGEPWGAIGHDAGKPTLSVATPPQDATFGTVDSRDANGHEVGKPTPSIATSPKTSYLEHLSLRMPLERRWKTDEERRNAAKMPYVAWVSLGMLLDTTLEKRRDATR
jgi:hypothetical protein